MINIETITLRMIVPDDYDSSRLKLAGGQKPEIIRQSDLKASEPEILCGVCGDPLDEAAIVEVGQCSACFTCNA